MTTKKEMLDIATRAFYPDYEKVVNDESISPTEAKMYFNYCASAPINKRSYNDFKTFMEMKEKARKNGIESIMFRSDVTAVEREFINGEDNVSYVAYRVRTAYGPFFYYKGRTTD